MCQGGGIGAQSPPETTASSAGSQSPITASAAQSAAGGALYYSEKGSDGLCRRCHARARHNPIGIGDPT
jgi:hypothetical protein